MSLEMLRGLFQRPHPVSDAPLAQGAGPVVPVHAVGEPIGQSERFGECLAHVLRHEGGYVDHPRDPGGATNMGVTIGTLSDWIGRPATKAEVRALSRDLAAAIYHRRYWLPVRGDALGPGLDLVVFDYGVNSGPARAVRTLQAALGVDMDGVMGAVTINALAGRDREPLIRDVSARRRAFLRGLSTYDTFGRGWERRVAEVEAAALAKLNL